ncbi:phosphatidylinositol-glycan-specific phospholipase D [Discoglossus pictus]
MADLYVWTVTLYVFSLPWLQTETCGISAHIEIAHRALEFFNQPEGKFNYKELIQKHPDAFQAGSVYPDAFYQDLCMQGKYHDVSEDSHWTPFLKASINYVRNVYPQPWNENAEKLVAFIFGITSHMVSDVSWHSLGIDQGFLRTMGEIDFHGSYTKAHQAGDFGADVLSQFELNLDYLEGKWYIPVKDLANIYEEFYGKTVIMEDTIVRCTYILFLQMYGESFAVSRLFPSYDRKSPFLVERFYDYFLGGVDDMAFWSTNIFQITGFLLENGTGDCYIPENPIYMKCNIQQSVSDRQRKLQIQKTDYQKDLTSSIVSLDGANITTGDTGVFFQFNSWGKNPMQLISSASLAMNMQNILNSKYANHVTTPSATYFVTTPYARLMQLISSASLAMNMQNILNSKHANHVTTPSATYFVTTPYARLGWAMTTADLNQDGQDDLIVGAPGYSTSGHIQVGRVYIVYGKEAGLPSVDMDLDKDADVMLEGTELSGRFGSSVAVLDFNLDGHLDLAVGAPSVGSQHLVYTGSVYVYFGSKKKGLSLEPKVITCMTTYCNLGWTLLATDVNGDRNNDLVIGSPYAAGGGKQRGLVTAFYSSRKINRKGNLKTEKAEWSMVGEHNYAWFGYSLHSHKIENRTLLIVGSPTWSSCKSTDCENKQSVGKAYGFYPPSTNTSFVVQGETEQSKLGSAFASGLLSVNGVLKQVLMVGAPSQSTTSKVTFISRELHHAGTTTVYELKGAEDPSSLHTMGGDREYARYGTKIYLSDLDNDGLDEVIVTAPLRTDDITSVLYGVEAGRVYIYNGNATSPGYLTKNCKSWISPCPEDWAQYVLISPEEKSTFGSAVTAVKSKQKSTVAVAAVRSSAKARLAGAVYIYNLD